MRAHWMWFAWVGTVGCASAVDDPGSGEPAFGDPATRGDDGVDVYYQALVVENEDCPAHVIPVRAGVPIAIDYSGLTMDLFGDPIRGDVRDGVVSARLYDDRDPDEVLAACGNYPSDEQPPRTVLMVDELVAERTVPITALPEVGGVTNVLLVSHGQMSFLAFLVPDAECTTTRVELQ